MRTRRFLLAASALSTLTFCKPEKPLPEVLPLPGNPKGTMYDAAMIAPPPDAEVLPLPGNPKGTMYDAGIAPMKPDAAASVDAPAAPRDAPTAPRDGRRPLPGNPKGSFYDTGKPNDPGL